MGTAPWRALYAALDMARMTEGGAFSIIALTISSSGAIERNFIIRFAIWSLSNLRFSFETEFPIIKLLTADDCGVAVYIVRELLSR